MTSYRSAGSKALALYVDGFHENDAFNGISCIDNVYNVGTGFKYTVRLDPFRNHYKTFINVTSNFSGI